MTIFSQVFNKYATQVKVKLAGVGKKITTFSVITGPTCVNRGTKIEELFGQLKMLFLTVKAGNELHLVVSAVILRLLLALNEKEF